MSDASDYPAEWCLEALRKEIWTFWLHGTMDEVISDYYYHRENSSYDRWRITAPVSPAVDVSGA